MPLTIAAGSTLAEARRGAVRGGFAGVTLSLALLVVGLLRGVEAAEDAVFLGLLFGLPLTAPVVLTGWAPAFTHLVAFLAIAVPVNSVLLGAAAGALCSSLGWRPRARAGIAMLLWLGAVIIMWVLIQAV